MPTTDNTELLHHPLYRGPIAGADDGAENDDKDDDKKGQPDNLPEKFKGKTPEQIAQMYEELESRFGAQGNELGRLRAQVQQLAAQPVQRDREQADKSEYAELATVADDLLLNPDKALPRIAEIIEKRVQEKVSRATSTALSRKQMVDEFFRANPELENYKEIVSVIGERIYHANPDRDFSEILHETKQQATAYIADLRARLEGQKDADRARKRAGITTSGNTARDGGQGKDDEDDDRKQDVDPEKAAILEEIQAMRAYRSKRATPPRSR